MIQTFGPAADAVFFALVFTAILAIIAWALNEIKIHILRKKLREDMKDYLMIRRMK